MTTHNAEDTVTFLSAGNWHASVTVLEVLPGDLYRVQFTHGDGSPFVTSARHLEG